MEKLGLFYICQNCGLITLLGEGNLCMPCHLESKGVLYKKVGRPRKESRQTED